LGFGVWGLRLRVQGVARIPRNSLLAWNAGSFWVTSPTENCGETCTFTQMYLRVERGGL